jgi:hypothetical protein
MEMRKKSNNYYNLLTNITKGAIIIDTEQMFGFKESDNAVSSIRARLKTYGFDFMTKG